MTEYTITRSDAAADTEALQNALNMLKGSAFWDSPTAKCLLGLRRSIEEQLPKAAIEEPTEFGSIARAGLDGLSDRVLWQRGPKHWMSEDGGFVAKFDWLDNPEVLRVGVGEPKPLAEWETELLQHQERREIAAAVLAAMDVDQYLIDAVTNATPDGGNAYNRGADDMAAKVRRELSAQAAQVITGPEKRCYADALAAVAALLGES